MAKKVEVTAAYWEARIKTYGFHSITDLSLFQLTLNSLNLPLFGQALCRMGDEGIPLVLTFSRLTLQGLSVCFVVPRASEGRVRDRMGEEIGLNTARALAVEVVYFYGPHFGDRYGIAEAALQAVAGSGIHATATACSGSCVYLVLSEGQSEEAVHALSQAFEIPRAKPRKSPGSTGDRP